MKKSAILLCLCLLSIAVHAQNILTSKSAAVSFFSKTPVEDIDGKSTTGSSAIDLDSKNIIFKVSNTSFQFKRKLMQEHFNENYMESDKYPFTTFKGKITDDLNFSKDGTYTLNAEGNLDVHGVVKSYQTKVQFVVANGTITAKTTFKVRVEDHHIKVPSIVFKNIAEVVDVEASAIYQQKK